MVAGISSGDRDTGRRKAIWLEVLSHVLLLGAIVVGAEIVSGRFVSKLVIPSPQDVLDAAVNWISSGYLLENALSTLKVLGIGFSIGLVVAFALAVLFTAMPRLGRFFEPYLIAFSSIPSVALVPVLVMWLGLGPETKITMGAIATFFPTFVNGYAGLKRTDRKLLELADIYRAGPLRRLFSFRLWSAAPYFVSGIKVAIPKAALSVIVAEYLAGNIGLGYAILRAGNLLDIGGVFTGVVVLTTLVFVISALIGWADRRYLSWGGSREGRE